VHTGVLTLVVPVLSSIQWPTLILALAAIVAMFRYKVGMIPTFAACSAAGVAFYLITGAV
jgi:chromate transporter